MSKIRSINSSAQYMVNKAMNNKQKIFSTFKELKIGSKQIGIFNQQTGNWCRVVLLECHEKKIVVECPELNDFPSPYVFMFQMAFSFSRRFSFLAKTYQVNNRILFQLPSYLLPITKVMGAEDDSSKRENYRVKPHEELNRVIFYNGDHDYDHDTAAMTGYLSDVSAGGLGLSIDMKTLQAIGEKNKFLIHFNLNLGIDKKKRKEAPLEIPATLCNARPLRNRQVQLGFSFSPDNNSDSDPKQVTQKLLNYVAQRQRQILKGRISTKENEKK